MTQHDETHHGTAYTASWLIMAIIVLHHSGWCGYEPNISATHMPSGATTYRTNGSIFHFCVPCKEGGPGASRSPLAEASGSPDGENVILIIDDTSSIRLMLTAVLKKAGYTTEAAEDGSIGLKMMCNKPYKMVFCDLMMPVMGGLECVSEFRAWERSNRKGQRQPISALTGQATGSLSQDCKDAGMDLVLSKPVNKTNLLNAVADLTSHLAATSISNSDAS